MIRVATLPLQRTLAAGLQQAQSKLATTQLQLNSGKKANDLAGLGTEAVRTLSARSMLAQQTAQKDSAVRLGTTLSLYDTNITDIDTAASELRQSILTAIGTGQTAGLQGTVEGSFSRFRSALNATDGSTPLFAGAQTGEQPFKPTTLAETAGETAATAFTNDDTRASSRVGQGIDLTYGVTASELGTGMLAAFRTLAEAGTIGDTPTAAQLEALKVAMGQIDTALPQVRTVNAANGQRQRQVETLESRAQDRADLLTGLISENEDADYGQISIDIEQQKTILTASYSVFQKLAGMSLANYL